MATLTYQDYQGSGSNASSYTFSGMGIGTADADRKVLACIGGFGSSGATPTSVTIGGVSATQVAVSATSRATAVVFEASVPTGTTGDVVANYSATQTRVACATYSAIDLDMTPFDTDTDTQTSGGADLVGTVTKSDGGYVLGVCWATFASDITWINLTEDLVPQNPEGDSFFTVASVASVGGSDVTVTAELTGGSNHNVLLVVSFSALGGGASTSDFFLMM